MSSNKTIKFFISSTFKDFLKERNALQNFVFPRLKKLCQDNKGFTFHPVDLRWGVTSESSDDNQTMQYCLNEVTRCSEEPKPNLLILLGQRYGWGPLPASITTEEWEFIKAKINKEELKNLENWYIQDKNDVYEKYFLKDKRGLERKAWENIENGLKSILQDATQYTENENQHIYKEYEHFHTSATEQEIKFAKANIDNTIIYTRQFSSGEDDDLIEASPIAQSKLTFLKGYLLQTDMTSIIHSPIDVENYKKLKNEYPKQEEITNSIYPKNFPKYLKDFCEEVYDSFKIKILQEINKYHQESDLKIELNQQKIFLENKSEVVIGRESEVQDIKDFVVKDSIRQFYLLYGESGSGKSSVMAKSILDLTDKKSKEKLSNEYKVIYRFIGTTAHTSSPRDTYEYIYWQIVGSEEKPKDIEYDDYKFNIQFREALKAYTQDKKLIIFIDAVDQFSNYSDLNIFIEELPQKVKVVFSTLYNDIKEDEEYFNYFTRISSSVEESKQLGILESSNKEILKVWFEQKRRTLQTTKENNQYKVILEASEGKTPLYLRLAFDIAVQWKSEDKITKDSLGETEEDLIIKYFENVEKNHYVKKQLLELTLGLISASKDGLSENELIEVLSVEKESILSMYERPKSDYPPLEKLPDSIFSKLYFHIQEFFTEKLIDDEMLITPFHRIIAETIKKNYYEENLHEKLEEYYRENSFDVMILDDSTIKKELKNFMYHLYQLKEFEKLELLLIMFNKEIVQTLYTGDFDDLLNLYAFKSETNEVLSLQNMKELVSHCLRKTDAKWEIKDFTQIEYKINEVRKLHSIFVNVVNLLGENNILMNNPQIEDLNQVGWKNEYSYEQVYFGLVGTDYENFDSRSLDDLECSECKIIRTPEQLSTDRICGQCIVLDNTYFVSSSKEWVIEKGFYSEEFQDDYLAEFEEWYQEHEYTAEDDYAREKVELDGGSFNTFKEFLDNRTGYDYVAYDLNDYIVKILGYQNIDELNLEESGFKYE